MAYLAMNESYLLGFETERLKIQALTVEDIPAWCSFFDDPNSEKYIPGVPTESAQIKAQYMINRQLNRYATGSYGMLGLRLKTNNQLIGICGFLAQDFDGVKELEIGYHLIPSFRRQGFATEAAQFFRDYAFENKITNRLVSNIHVENTQSQAVAMRNGFSLEKEFQFMGFPFYMYVLEKNK